MKLSGRRKQVLVHKFQYTLLWNNLFYLSMILLLFLITLFTPVVVTLYGSSSPEDQLAAATSFLMLHGRIWPAVGVAMVLICWHSVFASHRIAGPLYGFRRVFRTLAGGDLTVRAGVRKADYLGPDADAINEMIVGLGQRIVDIDRTCVAARESYGRCRQACEAHRDSDLELEMERLGELFHEVTRRLGELELGPRDYADLSPSDPEPVPTAQSEVHQEFERDAVRPY